MSKDDTINMAELGALPPSDAEKEAPDLSPGRLAQFTGTEVWYRHPLVRRVVYTEGVKYVADAAAAHWLLDMIAVCQVGDSKVADAPFQVWKLTVDLERRVGLLVTEDGDFNVVRTEAIPFTDFPAPEVVLWFTDDTILLPSEY